MKILALCLAGVSALTGLVAAYKWWIASRVNFKVFDENGAEIPQSDLASWLHATRLTMDKSASLNRSAAVWTAIAAASAGFSSLVGTLSAP